MVASLGVESAHGVDGLFESASLVGVGYTVVVEGKQRVVALLYGVGNVAHEGVEDVGAFDDTNGEDEGRVFLVLDLDPYLVLGEHVAGAEPELEGVAEVDGDGDGGLLGVPGWPASGGESPRGPREVHGNGVDVYAGHRVVEPVEQLLSGKSLSLRVFHEVIDRLNDKRAGAAGGVEDSLLQRVGDKLADHGAGEPVRGVVLPKPSSLVGRDDRLVQDGRDVRWRVRPVEPRDPVRQCGQ